MTTNDPPESKIIKHAMSLLTEHFDNVQIFCSRVGVNDSIERCEVGHGSVYASLGQIDLWLRTTRASILRSRLSDDDDDDEEQFEKEEE